MKKGHEHHMKEAKKSMMEGAKHLMCAEKMMKEKKSEGKSVEMKKSKKM